MTLIDHIRRAKESGGSRVAMIAGDRRWTYDEIEYSINHSGCRVGDDLKAEGSDSHPSPSRCHGSASTGSPDGSRKSSFEAAATSHRWKSKTERMER